MVRYDEHMLDTTISMLVERNKTVLVYSYYSISMSELNWLSQLEAIVSRSIALFTVIKLPETGDRVCCNVGCYQNNMNSNIQDVISQNSATEQCDITIILLFLFCILLV